MNLYKAELHRIARRRLTLIFGICAMIGLIVLSAIMWFTSRTGPTADELAVAEQDAAYFQEEYQRCVNNEDFFEEEWGEDFSTDPYYEGMTHEELCDEFMGWGTEVEDHYYFYTFHFENDGTMVLIGVIIVAGLLLMLIAASAIGAEWASGGMSNLLVWHPNRFRVWGAKLAAALTVSVVALIVFLVLAFGLLYLTASVRGQIGTLNEAWWEDALAQLSRTLGLGLGMTVLGTALAMLGRHTAIAGGVIAGYLIVGDLLVRLAGFAFNVKYPDLMSLYSWVGAWITGRMEFFSFNEKTGLEDSLVITSGDSALLLGGIIALFTVLATWSFAKRDVT